MTCSCLLTVTGTRWCSYFMLYRSC